MMLIKEHRPSYHIVRASFHASLAVVSPPPRACTDGTKLAYLYDVLYQAGKVKQVNN